MTRFDPDAHPETRRAQARYEIDSGCARASGCGGLALVVLACVACIFLWL